MLEMFLFLLKLLSATKNDKMFEMFFHFYDDHSLSTLSSFMMPAGRIFQDSTNKQNRKKRDKPEKPFSGIDFSMRSNLSSETFPFWIYELKASVLTLFASQFISFWKSFKASEEGKNLISIIKFPHRKILTRKWWWSAKNIYKNFSSKKTVKKRLRNFVCASQSLKK